MAKELYDEPALVDARTTLRVAQRDSASTVVPATDGQVVTDNALKSLEQVTRFTPTQVPYVVRRGAFKYDRALESTRIARAQAVIRRIAPGPFEDANYLAMLAYQAASVEMALERLPTTAGTDHFSKYLIGTVHAPVVNAFAQTVSSTSYTIVLLFSGLVDFMYQAAKVVVEALNPVRSTDPRAAVTALFDLDAIQERLSSNPGPIERLYRTLEAYLYKGYPRAFADEQVPEEQHPVLSLIVALAERWVIGHEYGHGLARLVEPGRESVHAQRSEEYFADANATIATVASAGWLDRVPPEFPLAGAIFALASLNMLQQAWNIATTGKDGALVPEQPTHPGERDRAIAVIHGFRQFFDVTYHANNSFEISFVARSEAPIEHNFSKEHEKRSYAYADVILTVWKFTKERLFADFRQSRPLHQIWRQTA